MLSDPGSVFRLLIGTQGERKSAEKTDRMSKKTKANYKKRKKRISSLFLHLHLFLM